MQTLQPRPMLRRWLPWIVAAVVLVYACAFQGVRPIYSPDEGRYTDVALGMLADGDWMRPMVHPEFVHMTKPPVTYWAIAASLGLLGHSEFAARLPNALALAGTIFLMLWLGVRITPQQRWLPALIYATLAFPSLASNIVTTDTLLTFFEALQLAAFAAWYWPDERVSERTARWLLWVGAALAFMTKGPPGLLILLGCLVFTGIDGGMARLRGLLRWDGLLAFVVIGGSWYAVVVARDPNMLHYFLVDEVIERVATDKMHRNGAWYDGFKIYLPTLLIGALPWLPIAAWMAWKNHRSPKMLWRTSNVFRWLVYCFCLPLIVFMISRSRLPLYILPLFPVLACLLASAIERVNPRRAWAVALLVVWAGALVGGRAASAFFDVRDDDKKLAEALLDILPARPAEVAFVEVAPRYGLRFYLDASVERLTLPGRRALPASEQIVHEMQEEEGCRVLIVDAANLPATLAILDERLVAYHRLPDVRGYVVLADESRDCPAYAAVTAK
jgi:4-amino-4-deoxy-L-arabinose transferase-like glycosyltransferase